MWRDAFKQRERSFEESYFRGVDTRLLERLRARATFGELASALKEKLEVDDPALLRRAREVGLTPETGAALLAAPLVEVAWADGIVSARERAAVLELAEARGVERDSPAWAMLNTWLDERPAREVFDVALQAIRAGLGVLPSKERAERVRLALEACHHVAMASGGFLALFGFPGQVSRDEERTMTRIRRALER